MPTRHPNSAPEPVIRTDGAGRTTFVGNRPVDRAGVHGRTWPPQRIDRRACRTNRAPPLQSISAGARHAPHCPSRRAPADRAPRPGPTSHPMTPPRASPACRAGRGPRRSHRARTGGACAGRTGVARRAGDARGGVIGCEVGPGLGARSAGARRLGRCGACLAPALMLCSGGARFVRQALLSIRWGGQVRPCTSARSTGRLPTNVVRPAPSVLMTGSGRRVRVSGRHGSTLAAVRPSEFAVRERSLAVLLSQSAPVMRVGLGCRTCVKTGGSGRERASRAGTSLAAADVHSTDVEMGRPAPSSSSRRMRGCSMVASRRTGDDHE